MRCLKVFVTLIANILTFVIVTALMQNSTKVHQQLKNMLYTPILLTCTTHNLLARHRLHGRVVFVFAHDSQIQVALALCKQGRRLISYTANKRLGLVTIAACYNCPQSPLLVLVVLICSII